MLRTTTPPLTPAHRLAHLDTRGTTGGTARSHDRDEDREERTDPSALRPSPSPSSAAASAPVWLIVQDDASESERLVRFIATADGTTRGPDAIDVATSYEAALLKAQVRPPDHVIIDARIRGGSGLTLIRPLRALNPHMRIVFCTAYPSIANSVQAMRLGADDYLTKPVTNEQILAAFGDRSDREGSRPDVSRASEKGKLLSLARARWEYINMVLTHCDGNVAASARHLGIHRQSLQRMLKRPPPTS